MLEYIEKMLEGGIHLQSNPEIRNNGFYQLDFTNGQTKAEISLRMKKIGETSRATEYELVEVLRVVGREDNGKKIRQKIEVPENMFHQKLHFYHELNAFGTSGTLSF